MDVSDDGTSPRDDETTEVHPVPCVAAAAGITEVESPAVPQLNDTDEVDEPAKADVPAQSQAEENVSVEAEALAPLFAEDEWVAVLCGDRWYLAQVLEIDSPRSKIRVNFLKRSGFANRQV